MLDHAGTRACALCWAQDHRHIQAQELDMLGVGRACLRFGVCQACGHIQQLAPPSDAQLQAHYGQFSNYTSFSDPAAARAEPAPALTRRLLGLLGDHGQRSGRLYEVGSAAGRNLHHARQAGWDVSGCEPSAKAVAQALEVYGIATETGFDDLCLARHADLDAIVMSHVLEHVRDPLDTLRRAAAALKPGGHLVLEVPCATAPDRLPPGWFSFEHLHYFQEETLGFALTQAGFVALEFRIALRAFMYPVVAAIAVKPPGPIAPPAPCDPNRSLAFAERYAARDLALWAAAVDKLALLEEPVIVWGAGAHTAQLIYHSRSRRHIRLRALADRDPQKWGVEYLGTRVLDPDAALAAAHDASTPIVVSSFAAEPEIARSLLDRGVPPSRIVRLYADYVHGP